MNKSKEKRQKKTPKQKAKIALKVLLITLLIIVVLFGICAIINVIGIKSNKSFIENSIKPVEYESQLALKW